MAHINEDLINEWLECIDDNTNTKYHIIRINEIKEIDEDIKKLINNIIFETVLNEERLALLIERIEDPVKIDEFINL